MSLDWRHFVLILGLSFVVLGLFGLQQGSGQELQGQARPMPTPSPETNAVSLPFIATDKGIASGGAPAEGEGSQGQPQDVPQQDHETTAVFQFLRPVLNYGAIALGLGFVLAYGLLERRWTRVSPMEERHVFEMLSSDTRLGILSELERGERTPTDLSSRLSKSKATVVEHLDRLIRADLVARRGEPGRKFVFYGLTPKGKEVLRKGA